MLRISGYSSIMKGELKVSDIPRIRMIANFHQVVDEIIDPILLQTDAQRKNMVRRSRSYVFPAMGYLLPGVL